MPATRRSGRATSLRFEPYDYGPCPSLVVQDEYFHTADEPAMEILVKSWVGDTRYKFPPENITLLRFDPTKWRNISRPPNYHGSWPPTSASELMDTHLIHEDWDDSPEAKRSRKSYGRQIILECLGKYCWQDTDLPRGEYCAEHVCNHTFADWLTGAFGWQERLELRKTFRMGYGLFSKRRWEKGDILGAYLGELLPTRPSNTEYCYEVTIGPAFDRTEAPVAYIDPMRYGNYVRFCNHSCENNANICEGRVGAERVLVLRATRRISSGEQITIDYGYFRDGQCLCGSPKCKYSGTADDCRLV